MIHYDLRCAQGHSFDGWFRSSTDFDFQADRGLLDCPVCASTQVSRAMMSPRLATLSADAAGKPVAQASPGGAPPCIPDQLRAALQKLRSDVERNCDYVGPRFASVARAISGGAEAPRPIYGEATPAEAESLAEDGIAVARIPWVERADG